MQKCPDKTMRKDKFFDKTTDQPKCVCPKVIQAILLKGVRHLQDDSVAAATITQRLLEIEASKGNQMQTKAI